MFSWIYYFSSNILSLYLYICHFLKYGVIIFRNTLVFHMHAKILWNISLFHKHIVTIFIVKNILIFHKQANLFSFWIYHYFTNMIWHFWGIYCTTKVSYHICVMVIYSKRMVSLLVEIVCEIVIYSRIFYSFTSKLTLSSSFFIIYHYFANMIWHFSGIYFTSIWSLFQEYITHLRQW